MIALEVQKILSYDLYYSCIFAIEIFLGIWIARIKFKADVVLAKSEAAQEEAKLKAELLSEYQIRDRLQQERITKLTGEVNYYKGSVGVAYGSSPKPKKIKDAK